MYFSVRLNKNQVVLKALFSGLLTFFVLVLGAGIAFGRGMATPPTGCESNDTVNLTVENTENLVEKILLANDETLLNSYNGTASDKHIRIWLKGGYYDVLSTLPPIGNDIEILVQPGEVAEFEFNYLSGFELTGNRSGIRVPQPELGTRMILRHFSRYGVLAGCTWGVHIEGLDLYVGRAADGIVLTNNVLSRVERNRIYSGDEMEDYEAFGPKKADSRNPNVAIKVYGEGHPSGNQEVAPCFDYPCMLSNSDIGVELLRSECPHWNNLVNQLGLYQVLVSHNRILPQVSSGGYSPWFKAGIKVEGSQAWITGNEISVADRSGIEITRSRYSLVEGNFIGLDSTGEHGIHPAWGLATGKPFVDPDPEGGEEGSISQQIMAQQDQMSGTTLTAGKLAQLNTWVEIEDAKLGKKAIATGTKILTEVLFLHPDAALELLGQHLSSSGTAQWQYLLKQTGQVPAYTGDTAAVQRYKLNRYTAFKRWYAYLGTQTNNTLKKLEEAVKHQWPDDHIAVKTATASLLMEENKSAAALYMAAKGETAQDNALANPILAAKAAEGGGLISDPDPYHPGTNGLWGKWYNSGIYLGCSNGHVEVRGNRISLYYHGIQMGYGPCTGPMDGPRRATNTDSAKRLQTAYQIYRNQLGRYTCFLNNKEATEVKAGNYIGLYSQLPSGAYHATCQPKKARVGGHHGVTETDTLMGNFFTANEKYAIHIGGKEGEYIMNNRLDGNGRQGDGSLINPIFIECAPDLWTADCMTQPQIVGTRKIKDSSGVAKVWAVVTGMPGAYAQVFGGNEEMNVQELIRGVTLNGSGSWSGEIAVPHATPWISTIQTLAAQGSSILSVGFDVQTLCAPVTVDDGDNLAVQRLAQGGTWVNPVMTGNEAFFQVCALHSYSFYTNAAFGKIYTDSLMLGDSTGYSSTVSPTNGQFTLTMPTATTVAWLVAGEYWACRKVIRIRVSALQQIPYRIRTEPLSCPQAYDGKIRVAVYGMNTVDVTLGANSSFSPAYTVDRNQYVLGDSTIYELNGLAAGHYYIQVAWAVGSPGGGCLPVVVEKDISAVVPEMTMQCVGLLPCRRMATDSVDFKFSLGWPLKADLVGTGKRYRSLRYGMRFAWGSQQVNGRVLWLNPQNSSLDTGTVRMPLSLLAPVSYDVWLTLFGDTCHIGCGRYVEICKGKDYAHFETPSQALSLSPFAASNDGLRTYEVCPGVTDHLSLTGSWHPAACPSGQTARLLRRQLKADGSPLEAPQELASVATQQDPYTLTAEHSSASPYPFLAAWPDSSRNYRFYVEVAGCTDSMDVRFTTVDTSMSLLAAPVTCADLVNGTASRTVTAIPRYTAGPISYTWMDSYGPWIYDSPHNQRIITGAGSVKATLGNGQCLTRSLAYNANIQRPPRPTLDYERPSATEVNCAITATLTSALTSGQKQGFLPGPFRAWWLAKRKAGERIDSSSYSGNPTAGLPIDIQQWTISGQNMCFWDSSAAGWNLRASLPDPEDGRLFKLVLEDMRTGCIDSGMNRMLYRKPDAERTFTVTFHWGPTNRNRQRDTSRVTENDFSPLITRLQEGQAECRSRLAELAAHVENNLLNSPGAVTDTVHLGYLTPPSHRTLYLYDKAGRLAATVPPHGVERLTATDDFTKHRLISWYTYNSAGELLASTTPDAGRQRMWYDRAGRLRFSRTREDSALGQHRYTRYDGRNRTVETGLVHSGLGTDTTHINDGGYEPAGTKKEYVQTVYDNGLTPGQSFMRNRVALSRRLQKPDPGQTDFDTVTTLYSYDPHGNVKQLWQVLPGIDTLDMTYDYDLVSGKVKEVWINSNKEGPKFGHRYTYDSDNRLTCVQVSKQGLYWEPQSTYQYFNHGPLKRLQLGSENVQGIDYSYTLQGWLKGINKGKAMADQDHENFPDDVFGMRLDYYNGDYKTSNNSFLNDSIPGFVSLYNGNIAAWTSHTPVLGANLIGQKYRYDALQRIKKSETFYQNPATNSITASPDFYSKYSYDQGGNILKLIRKGVGNDLIDSMLYTYDGGAKPTNNLLRNVNDKITTTDEGLSQGRHNYQYDREGRLTLDSLEGLVLHWSMDNKPSLIQKGERQFRYFYDAGGNRIAKWLRGSTGDTVDYMQRDGNGHEMVRLTKQVTEDSVRLEVADFSIFGGSRFGTAENRDFVMKEVNIASDDSKGLRGLQMTVWLPAGVDTLEGRQAGSITYSLEDHLGNVRATVSDNKVYTSTGTSTYTLSTDVRSASDYYPFGMEMRKFQPGYRFGFNGQEKVDEISGNGNHYTAEYWEMDPRLGRRWNIDPVYKHWISNYSVFGNNPILNIDPKGDDWFKNKAGDVKWDNSRGKSLGKGKDKWSNIGSTINIETVSGINKENDTPFPFSQAFSGDKLKTNISITGNYNEEGDFTGFSYKYDKTTYGTFDIDALTGVDYPSKPNTPDGKSGSWGGAGSLKFFAHVTTPDIETFGLKLIGRNVDVNQEISFSLGEGGLLNVGINHGTYPSMSMNVYGSANSEMINFYRYQQHSFISTHATKFWSRAAPLIAIKGGPVGAAFLIELRLRQNRALMLHQSLNEEYKKTNKAKFGAYND